MKRIAFALAGAVLCVSARGIAAAPEAIRLGEDVTGEVSAPGELRCYQIDTPKGTVISATVSPSGFAPSLQVFRGATCKGGIAQVEAEADAGAAASLKFTSAGGRYLIAVTSREKAGPFRLNLAGNNAGAELASVEQDAVDPRVALMAKQRAAYQREQQEAARRRAEQARLEAQMREYERQEAERRAEEARIERAEASARQDAIFGAFMQGIQTVANSYSQVQQERADNQARLNALAAERQRAVDAQAARERAAQQAQMQARQQQQAAQNTALAQKLAEANATRAQMIARTTDPAERARLEDYNRKAREIARTNGFESQFRAAEQTALARLPAPKPVVPAPSTTRVPVASTVNPQQHQQALNALSQIKPIMMAQNQPKPIEPAASTTSAAAGRLCDPGWRFEQRKMFAPCTPPPGQKAPGTGTGPGGTKTASADGKGSGGSTTTDGSGGNKPPTTPGGGGRQQPPGGNKDETYIWPEAVAICTVRKDGKLDNCAGPAFTGVLGGDEGRLKGAQCSTARPLGTQGEFKIFGCGYGINPRAKEASFSSAHHWDWILRKGLRNPPGRLEFRCKNQFEYCRTPA